MSNCWCKCEAGIGQCGPKVPKLKALFRSYKDGDDGPIRRNDRQAELESLWQECGEDKLMRQEDLKVALADAVDRVYDKCQEDALRRRAALLANVLASEERIRDILGIEAEIAPKELPLQTRLDANLSRLHELENLRGDGFGWMGGLVILMELRRRMSALRTTIWVPDGPEGTKLEEMLHSTMDALEHPDKDSSEGGSSKAAPRTLKKPMFERLESFYKNLCGLDGTPEPPAPASPSVERTAPSGRPPKAPKLDGEPVSPTGSASKTDYPQIRVSAAATPDLNREPKENYPLIIAAPTDIQEELTLESLGAKIIRKIDEINAKHAPPASAPAAPTPPPENKRPLPPSSQAPPQPKVPRCISISAAPFLWPPDLAALAETQRALDGGSSEELSGVSGGGSFFSSFFPMGGRSVQQTGGQLVNGLSEAGSAGGEAEERRPEGSAQSSSARRMSLFGGFFASGKIPPAGDISAPPAAEPDVQSSGTVEAGIHRADSVRTPAEQGGIPPPKTPLHQSASEGALSTPTVPPPPPPPRRVASSGGPAPPPPPPPPLRSKSGALLTQQKSKLKRSTKMGALYRGLRRKVEGTDSMGGWEAGQDGGGGKDGKGAKGAGGATAAGMAEMLGEITKRSAYFQQIAADVKQHATAIEQAKSAIEAFQTSDMDALTAFRTSIENVLENLTDESQVLARFEGFPSRKLETIRMAASLHSRLAKTAQDLEQWKVVGGAYEELERATKYFDKMRKEVEACERTQDEDGRRFVASKITFDWTTLTSVKEAAVGLSGRLLEATLQESKLLRSTLDFNGDPSPPDVTKVRQQVHTIWVAFQFAFRVYNFAGGQDEKGERLAEALAEEIEAYPAGAWS